jgi:hypothetical protein
LEESINLELKKIKPIIPESTHTTFITDGLADCIKSIQICEVENLQEDDNHERMINYEV